MESRTPPADPPLGLSRDSGHTYCWNDGQRVVWPIPSVTTILGNVLAKPALVPWAKLTTAACAIRNLDMLVEMRRTGGDEAATDWLKRIPDFQRDSAADLGTRIHQLAEQLAHGVEPVDVTPTEAPFVRAYRDFIADFRPRFLAVEQMVCSLKHGYAGTFDAVAEINGDLFMLDLKTARSGTYAETALQLSAYSQADFIGRAGSTTRFRIPRATRYAVVHVRPEGARLIEYAVDRATFAAFLEARRLFAWQQGQAKTVVGQPLIATERTVAA